MTKTLEISDETYEKIKEQLTEEEQREINCYEDLIGGKYFFRTVTYHSLGEVVKIVGKFAYLKDASWIADSGRFNEAIKNGTWTASAEIEYIGNMFVNLDTVVDFFPWKHKLPKETK